MEKKSSSCSFFFSEDNTHLFAAPNVCSDALSTSIVAIAKANSNTDAPPTVETQEVDLTQHDPQNPPRASTFSSSGGPSSVTQGGSFESSNAANNNNVTYDDQLQGLPSSSSSVQGLPSSSSRVQTVSALRKAIEDIMVKATELIVYASICCAQIDSSKFIRNPLEGDLMKVLNKCWSLDQSPVLLKRWHPMFDARTERVDHIPIWVKMPGLPMQYWTEFHLKGIGSMLGTVLEVDLSFQKTHVMQVARVLVSINIREGLAENITLKWGPDVIIQLLDYENVPFRCRRCHVYGHPISECNLPERNTAWGKKKQAPCDQPNEPEIAPESANHSEAAANTPGDGEGIGVSPSVPDASDVVPSLALAPVGVETAQAPQNIGFSKDQRHLAERKYQSNVYTCNTMPFIENSCTWKFNKNVKELRYLSLLCPKVKELTELKELLYLK